MQVEIVNDGPTTIIIDSKNKTLQEIQEEIEMMMTILICSAIVVLISLDTDNHDNRQ